MYEPRHPATRGTLTARIAVMAVFAQQVLGKSHGKGQASASFVLMKHQGMTDHAAVGHLDDPMFYAFVRYCFDESHPTNAKSVLSNIPVGHIHCQFFQYLLLPGPGQSIQA